MPETTTFQITPKKHFLALLKDADLKKDKLASVSGELGSRIKEASDNGHLNRGAFGLILKLYRMEEDKRSAFLRNFDAYREYADEAHLFGSEHVGDLDDMARRASTQDDEASEAEDQQAADDAQTAANVEALTDGIKPLDQSLQVRMADSFELGRIAFLNGQGGVVPDDLSGKVGDSWLDGWRSVQMLTAEERLALQAQREAAAAEPAPAAEPFEDDAVATKPSRRGRKADLGDAPGSYHITH